RDGGRADERPAGETGLPLFPPGPGDALAWRAILAARPDLAPARRGNPPTPRQVFTRAKAALRRHDEEVVRRREIFEREREKDDDGRSWSLNDVAGNEAAWAERRRLLVLDVTLA